MLKKVISGGQIGVDMAGVGTAHLVGLETGGMMPKGFRTKLGPLSPTMVKAFGFEEHGSPYYAPRTAWNVKHSDGTIRLAHNFDSPGEKCTLRYIKQYDKPRRDVPLRFKDGRWQATDVPENVAYWINANNIETLNVAGNALPDLEYCISTFLLEVFELCRV